MNVKEVVLDIVLPGSGLGIVLMQPFVELSQAEPYRWEGSKRDVQIDRIQRTLEIAQQADHGCDKTHFTVLPEYSTPGLEGIARIDSVIRNGSWKDGTVIIAGVDGLEKEEYQALCAQDFTDVCDQNSPTEVPDGEWVNCVVIWARSADSTVKRWIQPKVVPAGPEELCPGAAMFRGAAMYLFKLSISVRGSEIPFRFLCFICKDWIGNSGDSRVVDLVLSQLSQMHVDSERIDIYLSFVLQRNPDPEYDLFLRATAEYINETDDHIKIRRCDGAVVLVNNAGKDGPGFCSVFGKSGFVFHPNCSFVSHKQYCPPTYTLKKRAGLTDCKEARCREDGSCILSFKYIPPIATLVRRSPATTMIPLHRAIVHPADSIQDEEQVDPRTPGAPVPASIKWVNDHLDEIGSLLRYCADHPLADQVKNSHVKVSAQIRRGKAEPLHRCIATSSCETWDDKNKSKWLKNRIRKTPCVDNWDSVEVQFLETLVHSLSIFESFSAPNSLQIKLAPVHGTLKLGNDAFDIIVASGKTHPSCKEHVVHRGLRGESRRIILITRNHADTSWHRWHESILYTDPENVPKITDPRTRFIHCGYKNLQESCYTSLDSTDFKNKIRKLIGVPDGAAV